MQRVSEWDWEILRLLSFGAHVSMPVNPSLAIRLLDLVSRSQPEELLRFFFPCAVLTVKGTLWVSRLATEIQLEQPQSLGRSQTPSQLSGHKIY